VALKQALSLHHVREVLAVGEARIDRVLYRSGAKVEIVPQGYRVEAELFQNAAGVALSDHEAVAVRLRLSTR
jgi:hypothetical protein